MTITPKFPLASTVYLVSCPAATGIVTGYQLRPGNVLQYLVSFGTEEGPNEQVCLACELTDERTFATNPGD